MTQITHSQILAEALAVLWDGVDGRYWTSEDLTKYGCHAVTLGYIKVAGLGLPEVSWYEAQGAAIVDEIHNRIARYIGGFGTAYGYIVDGLGQPHPEDNVLQDFRKKMLEEIKAEYEARELLQEQIRILKEVKELREADAYDSPYVCDNINCQLKYSTTDAGVAICDDINKYIDGSFSVRNWLGDKNGKHYANDDLIVEAARIEMIDTLIARYTEQLEAA
jgi:hypothetical protein